jgi:hypothetical protein
MVVSLEDLTELVDDDDDDEQLLEQMAREIIDDAELDEFKRLQHAFTGHWARDWIRRNGYSLRVAHNERRPSVSEEEQADRAAKFRIDCRTCLINHFRRMLADWWNMDESKMVFMAASPRTITHIGAEGVTVHYQGDAKASLTIIAFVNAVGGKGPVIVVAKGITPACERKIREAFPTEIASGKLIVFHQKESWVDEPLAIQFLEVLSEQPSCTGRKALVWDVFSAHRTQAVKDKAESLGILLKYIPAGMTGAMQPLDYRIFGDVKGRVRGDFSERIMRGETAINVVEALKSWLRAWVALAQDAVIRSWDPIFEGLTA